MMRKVQLFNNNLPDIIFITAGAAEGTTELNAFDNALLKANIGNLNLLKVSSIMPAKCKLVKTPKISPGSLIPVAYGSITSSQKGQRIAAAVAVGINKDSSLPGVITEYSHSGSAAIAEKIVENMVKEAFEKRKYKFKKIEIISSEHIVKRIGGVIAAAVLWWKDKII